MNSTQKSYLGLHFAVLLFGFTAILGDLIQLSAFMIVWWRVLLAAISYFFLTNLKKSLTLMTRIQLIRFLLIGVLVALHWLCFYGSIKYANASVALVCMATTSFFTALIEPIVMRTKVSFLNIFLGLLVIPAMVLIVHNLQVDMLMGVWLGILAALLASIFSTLNKCYIDDIDPTTISFLEISGAWIFLSLCLPFYVQHPEFDHFLPPNISDWFYMIILVLLCTTLAYYLALKSLQHISAFASNLVINLEPVYGIFLAILILQEHKELNSNFYIGVGIIILVVSLYPFIKKKAASHE